MLPEYRLGAIAHDLTTSGFSVSDDLMDHDLVAALAESAQMHARDGLMTSARTGKARIDEASVRGDSIVWLDAASGDASNVACLGAFESLRQSLNQQLFLNLHDIECHFALYPPGAVYQKHLDRFSTGDQRRQISLILYLNEQWNDSDGGELRRYLDEPSGGHMDISPIAGRLVLFESSRYWHEVRPASRERLSISGWFRTRS